ncbi:nuclear transport factor 2 family protein [Sphingomonas arantia]|uniref:Nuclear transport factor 2 family protein n=1 Tax=Sphingomonas arantia TaxID=1460676 RepID=A0ABW4TYT3_9SPHN
MVRLSFAVALAAVSVSAPAARPAASSGPAEIRTVVAAMEAAWNRGDFRGYMRGFANPGVVFVSRGKIQDGWQGTLDHYIREYDGAAERRGVLRFWDLKIEMLAPDAAMLVGRYRLNRPVDPQTGINTRLFRKIGGRWVVTMNHVSSLEAPARP